MEWRGASRLFRWSVAALTLRDVVAPRRPEKPEVQVVAKGSEGGKDPGGKSTGTHALSFSQASR